MFIEIKRTYECSKCGGNAVENLSDERYRGIRCKRCGHEQKDLHPHIKATSSDGTTSWGSSPDTVHKF